jgi:hypothetical protein
MAAFGDLLAKGLARIIALLCGVLSKHRAVAAVITALALHSVCAAASDPSSQVVFLYPTNGMVFSSPYTGVVAVSDDSQATTRLDLLVNGAVHGTTSNSFLLTTLSNLAANVYTLAAVASDITGPIATNSITIKVVNDVPPTVTLVGPTNDTVFFTGSPVGLRVAAEDSDGTIQRVEFYHQPLCGVAPIYPSICPPTYLGASTSSPFSLTLTNLAPGFYHLIAIAYDNSGVNSRSDSIRVIITDPVSLTLPSHNRDGSFSFHVHFDRPVSTVNVLASADLVKWTQLPLSPPLGNDIVFKDTDASMFQRRYYCTQSVFQELLPP